MLLIMALFDGLASRAATIWTFTSLCDAAADAWAQSL
jgi:hypothetical protein